MDKKAERIQTSFLNGVERKALVWLAERQPRWVTSDMLTWLGTTGSFLIFLGYALSNYNVQWLWLSTLGLVVNWYGDSLDGTLARVRMPSTSTFAPLKEQFGCLAKPSQPG